MSHASHHVVESDDAVVNACGCLSMGIVATHPLQLAFELTKETLCRGIVGAASHGTHAGGQAMLLQPLTQSPTGVLRASIGMEGDLLRCHPGPDRHGGSLNHQLRGLPRVEGPSHDDAVVEVSDLTPIQPAIQSPELGDVGDPLVVGTVGMEPALQPILGHRVPWGTPIA